jgi:hypothetical protein
MPIARKAKALINPASEQNVLIMDRWAVAIVARIMAFA